MQMVPKNMDEVVKIAKVFSVKVAGTISRLCESYVEKMSAETAAPPADKPATAESSASEANRAPEEPSKTD